MMTNMRSTYSLHRRFGMISCLHTNGFGCSTKLCLGMFVSSSTYYTCLAGVFRLCLFEYLLLLWHCVNMHVRASVDIVNHESADNAGEPHDCIGFRLPLKVSQLRIVR